MPPKQSSIQIWYLFRILAPILGVVIFGENALKYWELFLILQEILDLIMTPRPTESLLTYMSHPIKKYLI